MFQFLAEKMIRAYPDGRRRLALYGPFAPPYDVSSPDTEERIIRRLSSAYPSLSVPALFVALFVFFSQNIHMLFWGAVATLFVAWLIVKASLQPDLRFMRRVEGLSFASPATEDFDRTSHASEYFGLFSYASEQLIIRRRRRNNLVGFLASCALSVSGLAIIFDVPAFGYLTVVFFGTCALRWWNLVRLPTEAILEIRLLDDIGNSLWPQATPAEPLDGVKPDPRRLSQNSTAGLWDREIDGGL